MSAPDLALRPVSARLAPVVELVADLACPWCYLGLRRLRRLQRELPLVLRWRPFLLDPRLPPEGVERGLWRARRQGSAEAARRQDRRLLELGAEEGIDFQPARIRRMPRTVAAHALLLRAQRRGLLELAAERLFAAFFCEGRDIGDPAVLAAEAQGLGLAPLDPAQGEAAVLRQHESAVAAGVTGVPLFRFTPGLSIAGAQPLESLRAMLELALIRERAEAQGRQGS